MNKEMTAQESETNEAWGKFVDFLKARGDRVTQARRIVFEKVFLRHDHFCADDLAADLAVGQNHVSRGTVYRTLDLMVESGFVSKIRDSDVHAHYEHTYGHPRHDHLICNKCGRFIEFTNAAVPEEISRVCAEHHFEQNHYRLVVFGICSDCVAKA